MTQPVRAPHAVLLLLVIGCPDSFPPPGTIELVCQRSCPREALDTYLAAQCESTELQDDIVFVCRNPESTTVVYQDEDQLELPIPIDELETKLDFALGLLNACNIHPSACEARQPPSN